MIKISKKVADWFKELEQQKEQLTKTAIFWNDALERNRIVARSTDPDVRKDAVHAIGSILKRLVPIEDELKQVNLNLSAEYANLHLYTDIEPYEIVEWVSPKMIKIRHMKSEIIPLAEKRLQESFEAGGFCGHLDNGLQDWNIETDENKEILVARRHKDGAFYCNGLRFVLNRHAVKFHDYNL